ncbi:hypothetical protein OBK16_12735 [Empedobacter falsenii]
MIGKNVIPDSFIGKKAEIVCDKMAQQRNLPSAKDRGKIEKENIKNAILSSKAIATSWNDFIIKMYERGYHFELSKNVNGINGARVCNLEDIENHNLNNFKLDKQKGYKLSQINRKLKVAEIENQLLKNTILIDLKRQNNENIQPKFKR